MNNQERIELTSALKDLYEKALSIGKDLTALRDLCRTDMPPEPYNMTKEEWDRHRLARVAQKLSEIIGQGYYD
jgi:hypothetical protein